MQTRRNNIRLSIDIGKYVLNALLFLVLFFSFPSLSQATCCVCTKEAEGEIESVFEVALENKCFEDQEREICDEREGTEFFDCSFRIDNCGEIAECKAADDSLCPPGKFCPQVTIPGSDFQIGAGTDVTTIIEPKIPGDPRLVEARLLPRYIRAIYQYGVWVAIVLAIFMIMVGGFLWLISGGSSERVSTAKSFINHALVGLIIALFSYGILATINPRTVNLETLQIDVITSQDVNKSCCLIDDGKVRPRFVNPFYTTSECKDLKQEIQNIRACEEFRFCACVSVEIGLSERTRRATSDEVIECIKFTAENCPTNAQEVNPLGTNIHSLQVCDVAPGVCRQYMDQTDNEMKELANRLLQEAHQRAQAIRNRNR